MLTIHVVRYPTMFTFLSLEIFVNNVCRKRCLFIKIEQLVSKEILHPYLTRIVIILRFDE